MAFHAVKPELPTPFPPVAGLWVCPVTGLEVPKDPTQNLVWRSQVLDLAEHDRALQEDLYTASAQSVLFWINSFVYTFRIFESAPGKRRTDIDQHVPFVTWPIQDKHIVAIEKAIDEGYDLLTDKTRDMGASWTHIAVLHHQWLFRPDRLFLEISRVETDVDGSDNPRCLFVKHDYINRYLPEWMRPPGVLPGEKYRTKLHIVNPTNGSRIDGESSNKAAGSGDRRHAILLDEFAKQENAEKIKAATADVTPCRLPNSTPFGPGTAYSKWRHSGQVEVFCLPWWEHPEKGRDRYTTQGEDGKWQIRSPWYDAEAERRTPKEMAQEIDMDHIGSGDLFFEPHILEQHKQLFARPHKAARHINFKGDIAVDAIPEKISKRDLSAISVTGIGNWRFWVEFINGRLDQTKTYILGCDISRGMGASNSVCSVYCKETYEKVAEYADANTPPYEFAQVVAAAAIWVGGASNRLPLVIWEANGAPGWDFGRTFVKVLRYPHFYVDATVGTPTRKKGKKYGWHSSRNKKAEALGLLRRAYAHGGFINHCAEAIDEAMMYIQYDDGSIGPSALLEENAEARATHGDRVIADMLCLLGVEDSPLAKHKPLTPPPWSFEDRKRRWMEKQKPQRRARKYDYRFGA